MVQWHFRPVGTPWPEKGLFSHTEPVPGLVTLWVYGCPKIPKKWPQQTTLAAGQESLNFGLKDLDFADTRLQ